MEREVGGGIGMGNTCKPMAISFQCMTKSTIKKKKKDLKRTTQLVKTIIFKNMKDPRENFKGPGRCEDLLSTEQTSSSMSIPMLPSKWLFLTDLKKLLSRMGGYWKRHASDCLTLSKAKPWSLKTNLHKNCLWKLSQGRMTEVI